MKNKMHYTVKRRDFFDIRSFLPQLKKKRRGNKNDKKQCVFFILIRIENWFFFSLMVVIDSEKAEKYEIDYKCKDELRMLWFFL